MQLRNLHVISTGFRINREFGLSILDQMGPTCIRTGNLERDFEGNYSHAPFGSEWATSTSVLYCTTTKTAEPNNWKWKCSLSEQIDSI